MLLAYLVVCPWKRCHCRIAGYLFPALDSVELYRLADKPVYLPHVVVGLGLTGILVWLNYHGIRGSATFQNWTTFGRWGCLRHWSHAVWRRVRRRISRRCSVAGWFGVGPAGDANRSLFHDRFSSR